jgi:hypothetical protein
LRKSGYILQHAVDKNPRKHGTFPEITIVLGVIADLLRKKNLDADKPEPQAPDISLTDLLNPKKLKRIMAQQFEDAGGDVSLGGTINRLLVEDRNKACIKVLQQQLTARAAPCGTSSPDPSSDGSLRADAWVIGPRSAVNF